MKMRTLSIGTFNLYNLNEPGLPMYSDRDGWSHEVYGRKIAWTQHVIGLLRPDILGFQELWHGNSLKAALEASGLADDYDMLVPDDADGQKIVCAAIVRRGLLEGDPDWIVAFPERFLLKSTGDDPQTPEISVAIESFSRPVLHFRIRPREDEPAVQVYVCHLKSKSPTKVYREAWFHENEDIYKKHQNSLGAALSTIRRTAEAAALRFLLSEQMKGTRTPVIVLGDINDGQHSNTANILTEQPRYLVGDSKGGGDVSLYTAQTLQEYRSTRDVYYTHIYKEFRESLDHILVSEEFYDNSRRRLWMFDGMTVANDHLNYDDHKESGTSDHGVICATFKHRPIKVEAREIAEGGT
ncbi:endonuclease/exonuclease/phosphatase family protein [Afifella marina]|uniref:Endonuclease/Exonuclease/phosphatase family protein n=1 Tax=Afifella marina DSM 2698 TaxID=1120955 RepID=A0A1G5NYD8_AFIMA|nr:endonuclease/exonuclease/phosphatase family protein [Afifella marina]MBK1624437.1 nuclease [Afifella marina DSM 2698]MBK1628169.1 nuclease [Afifella marina]MBK5916603.1 nuclease [Afifella marina]RAI18961.1 nuclease [Afifella marina DSM 2698]SCZ41781.1 Endonuclease/Exonuclease/phosphatase family protein [Afifella marina DSM 2698]